MEYFFVMVFLDMFSFVILVYFFFFNIVISCVFFFGILVFGGWRWVDIWKWGLMIVNNYRID